MDIHFYKHTHTHSHNTNKQTDCIAYSHTHTHTPKWNYPLLATMGMLYPLSNTKHKWAKAMNIAGCPGHPLIMLDFPQLVCLDEGPSAKSEPCRVWGTGKWCAPVETEYKPFAIYCTRLCFVIVVPYLPSFFLNIYSRIQSVCKKHPVQATLPGCFQNTTNCWQATVCVKWKETQQ